MESHATIVNAVSPTPVRPKGHIPENHPFLSFESLRAEGNLYVYIGVQNLTLVAHSQEFDPHEPDRKVTIPFYDRLGTSTGMGLIPESLLEESFVGKDIKKQALDHLVFSLVTHFIADILHRTQIPQREAIQLWDAQKATINWTAVPAFLHLLICNLFFLRFEGLDEPHRFVLRIRPRGSWQQADGTPCKVLQSVEIPWNKVQVEEFCFQLQKNSDETYVNHALKGYFLSQIAHWMIKAQYEGDDLHPQIIMRPNAPMEVKLSSDLKAASIQIRPTKGSL